MTTIEAYQAITLRNYRDVHIAERDGVHMFRTRGPKQRAPCWTIEDNMDMLDTVLRGFQCGPIYIIQDIQSKIDDVFDGAHRCEAIFDFIDNKYPVTKGKKDTIKWETSQLRDYVGKYFRDLPLDLQKKIKDYKFYINKIDPETANDPVALGMLWERLSKAGKALNNFEAKIQTHAILQKNILEPSASLWLESQLFPAKQSKRGQVEVKLHKLLALSEKEVLSTYGSMEDLVNKWCEEVLGKTTEAIDTKTLANKDLLIGRLKFIRNILKELQDRDVFHVNGKSIVDKSKDVPILIILGRLGYWFTSMSYFKRVADEVCPKIHDILKMNSNDLCKHLEVNSRNATYQKKLVSHIDSILREYSEKTKERRLFTQSEKKAKLDEQGGVCAKCKKPVHEYHRNDGDHIVEFRNGGHTTFENLQILHKLCHENKNR
jgi:5-methylcytosine-specific restriction endonuclease McrA